MIWSQIKIARLWQATCFAACCGFSVGATAQGSIEAITGSVQNGAEVVRIQFTENLPSVPTGFSIQSPARIALDFQGVGNATGRNFIDVNQGNLKSANVVQAGDRSRVVLNLKSATSYRTDLQGKVLLVTLDPVAASTATPVNSTVFAEDRSRDVQPLKDIDFRRGSDGAGRLVVGLPNNQVGVDLRKQGENLVIEFLHSSLPEGLRRRLDVTDFGTPVQLVTTTPQGDRIRMTVRSVGEWEHSAYQSDSQFVVEIRQKKVDVTKLSSGTVYSGEKLSLNFQNIEVRSLLQVIADFTNFNIVTSDTVTGALTLRLKDVPWDQALQIIMDARGLGMRKSGTVLWIAPKDEIDARTRKDYEAALAIQKLEPLRTQSYQLNYAKAADMVTQLTTSTGGSGGTSAQGNRFLSERGSAIAEPRTNQLFVTDTPAKLEEVRLLLLTLDVAVRQVMIEARIVEARDTFGRSLGVKLGGGDLRAQRGGDGGYSLGGGNRVALGTSFDNATGSAGFGTVNTGSSFVNLPASLSGGAAVGSFALSIFNSAANRFLTLELSALEAEGNGKIVSSPRLITADQTKALIEQGTEYPYSVTAPNGATTIAFKKAVLKLEVTPQITPEGNIILDLDVNKDSRGETTTQGVAIDTKHVKTQVLVENGGTVVIGGIFEMEETNQENKIPLLGDVPVVGNLFKNRTRETSKREVLIFITPKVISDKGPVR
ncbi:type IV pilus secretin PilQ [Paracidovorax wautersii]|uniref:Type IV pilus biogenesis and competence protein PilQ n=1 Tax=Paracidovorax wautersii TaxID=1177982 RepID=A0ABU1IBZ6_9BURK|nr:type IV pilus secretin PilQ [Paracidovorax wautersii]MDR6214461.1 type IV pilus assembly protein PilQ [Paracidovorax wautersii]